jgi:MFS family permease
MLKAIPYRYRVLALLCSLATLTYLDRICISIVGVRVKDEFHLNNEQFGWVLASFALAYALFEIPSGALGDRIGPRAVFIRIVLAWSNGLMKKIQTLNKIFDINGTLNCSFPNSFLTSFL